MVMQSRLVFGIIRMRGCGLEGYLAFPLLWYSEISAACSADLIVEIRA
jgi:hypothetical protein